MFVSAGVKIMFCSQRKVIRPPTPQEEEAEEEEEVMKEEEEEEEDEEDEEELRGPQTPPGPAFSGIFLHISNEF